MISEAIDKVLGLAAPYREVIDDREYTDSELTPIMPPIVSLAEVKSLTALRDLAVKGFEGITTDGGHVFQVESPTSVSVYAKKANEYAQRPFLLRATVPQTKGFPFGSFQNPEEFVIALQVHFVLIDSDDLTYVLQSASRVTSEAITTAEDNGITQVATFKKGASGAFKEQAQIKSRVNLSPFRTFREVVQPTSAFLFRLRQDSPDKPPSCALFEADGGVWQLEAMKNIATWLKSNLPTSAIVVA